MQHSQWWMPSDTSRVALVSDRNSIITKWVSEAGVDATFFRDIHALKNWCQQSECSLILLDLTGNLSALCKMILRSHRHSSLIKVPIILVAPCNTEDCMVQAVEEGVVDYIPSSTRRTEFLARLKLNLYRNSGLRTEHSYPPFFFDVSNRRLYKDGLQIKLTAREFAVALYFFKNRRVLISRQSLLSEIWNIESEIDTRRVDTYISRIRSKLDMNDSKSVWQIKSVYNEGYLLEKSSSG